MFVFFILLWKIRNKISLSYLLYEISSKHMCFSLILTTYLQFCFILNLLMEDLDKFDLQILDILQKITKRRNGILVIE